MSIDFVRKEIITISPKTITNNLSFPEDLSEDFKDFIFKNNAILITTDVESAINHVKLNDNVGSAINHAKLTKKVLGSLIPAIGGVSESFIEMDFEKSSIPSQFRDENFGKVIARFLVQMMTETGVSDRFWDERRYYHFIALNDFLQNGKNLTYGEFLKQEESKIEHMFYKNSSNYFTHTDVLQYTYQKNSGSIMTGLYDLNPDFIAFYETLDAAEIKALIEIDKSVNSSYKRRTKELQHPVVLEEIRKIVEIFNQDGLMSDSEINDSIIKSLLVSVDSFGLENSGPYLLDFISEATGFIDETLMSNVFGYVDKYEMAIALSKIAPLITPTEFITLFVGMDSLNVIGDQDSTINQRIELFNKALTSLKKPVDFVDLVYQMIVEYNGHVPSYDDWVEAIEEDVIDWSLGPAIVTGFVIGGHSYSPRPMRDFREMFSHKSLVQKQERTSTLSRSKAP